VGAQFPEVMICVMLLLVLPVELSIATIEEVPAGVEQKLVKDQESLPVESAESKGVKSVCVPEESVMIRLTGLFGVYPSPSKLNVVPCAPEQLVPLTQETVAIVRVAGTQLAAAVIVSVTLLLVLPVATSVVKREKVPTVLEQELMNIQDNVPLPSADKTGISSV